MACRYSQIPGIDFLENYSSVINDIKFQILIWVLIKLDLKAKIVDVETAFLYGNIEEEISMECPPGMTDAEDDDH